MGRRREKFEFENGQGQKLAGIVDMPEKAPLCYAVFGPCFTCVKESNGAFKISRSLADLGVATLRFDTTGVGESEGALAETTFTTRISDIIHACRAIEAAFEAPRLFVGHSISGTAILSAAKDISSLKVIATVGSPADPRATIDKFRRDGQMEEAEDGISINVIGRKVSFGKNFLPDMLAQTTAEDTARITQKLLIFHAPNDKIVSFDNAAAIKARAGAGAELIALSEAATHLFEKGGDDAVFIAERLVREIKSSF